MRIADFTVGMLGANGVVAAGIPIASGAAHALKIQRRPHIVACFLGDGAINCGLFLEGLNWAQVVGPPVPFVCAVGWKFVTMRGYVADPLIFVVNKEVWESWTPADREIVRQAAIDAGKQEIAIARKGLDEPGQPLLKEIEALGVKVTQLAPAERQQFVRATRAVCEQWKKQIGADLVTRAERSIAARK